MRVSPDIEINQQEVPDVKKAYFKPSITALGLLRSVTKRTSIEVS